MAEKTMHHVVIGGDTFELIDEAGREETASLKEDINDLSNTQTLSVYSNNEISGIRGVAVDVDLPAGKYIFSVGNLVSSDTTLKYSGVKFQNGNTIVLSVSVPHGENYSYEITLPSEVDKIAFYGKTQYNDSANISFAYTDVKIAKNTNLDQRLIALEDTAKLIPQMDYYHGRLSFGVTQGVAINTRKLFDTPIPAGRYSIMLSGITGSFYVSLVDQNGTVLTQTQTWSKDKKEYVDANADVYGIAVYANASWIKETTTIVIDVLRENRITADEDLIYANSFAAKTPIGYQYNLMSKSGNTITYTGDDNTSGIQSLIDYIVVTQKSGKIYLPNGVYIIKTPIVVNSKSLAIDGEVWNYPDHPNGVVPSTNGTVLKLDESNIFGIDLKSGNGLCVYNIGIVGSDWDTSGLFDRSNPSYNVGIFHRAGYSDQIDIRKCNFNGLASAFCASPGSGASQVDAASVHDCNMDGCDIGVIIDNATSIYSKWFNNLIADTPSYGIFMSGVLNGVIIKGNTLVRNSGKFSSQQKADFATEGVYAMYLSGASRCIICDNIIHMAGTFYDITDPQNPVTITDRDANGLYFSGNASAINGNSVYSAENHSAVISGDNNTITGNYFSDKTGGVMLATNYSSFAGNKIATDGNYGLTIAGNGNMISGNGITKKIKVTGNYNTVICSGTSKIEIDSGATGNILIGFATSDITDNGSGTNIR